MVLAQRHLVVRRYEKIIFLDMFSEWFGQKSQDNTESNNTELSHVSHFEF